MHSIPKKARSVIAGLEAGFTRRTWVRFTFLMFAAILTMGQRTVSNVLRTMGNVVSGHACSYHRVFSRRRWSSWRVAYGLATFILRRWLPQGKVPLVGDDTVDEHRGKHVYGKACHRDAVRSTHSYTAYRWGHKWVVLAILVRFPFSNRPWALPVLVALYRSAEWNRKHKRRHKTPAELMRQLLALLIHWFPQRKFVFAGDGGFGTHPLASFAHHHRKHLTLVSRFYAGANLYAPPPVVHGKKNGRPRKKGAKQPSPAQVVAATKRRQRLQVAWYGGGRREVAVVSGTAHWYKGGDGLIPVRWVFVHDCTGTHREEYFFTTDVSMTPKQIIETFTGRWSIETTFQEMRAHLGLETTRGRLENTVLRVAPCLFGLYSVVALLYAQLPVSWRSPMALQWSGKEHAAFSDAIGAVRRWLWVEWAFVTHGQDAAFTKLPGPLRKILLAALAQAA
jgi:hypothetical protein